MPITGKAMPAMKDGGERAKRGLAIRARSFDNPGGGEPAEHGEGRHHEDEMAQPVIERRPRRHGRGDGEDCGKHQHDQARRGG